MPLTRSQKKYNEEFILKSLTNQRITRTKLKELVKSPLPRNPIVSPNVGVDETKRFLMEMYGVNEEFLSDFHMDILSDLLSRKLSRKKTVRYIEENYDIHESAFDGIATREEVLDKFFAYYNKIVGDKDWQARWNWLSDLFV
jgi:hypothetical protein